MKEEPMSVPIKTPKKLIEVALPLDEINKACAREKSIRHGHPSTLHLWWARRPLAAARAVLFAQLVNDPGYERYLGRGVNKEKATLERERLFKLIERLVVWENSNDPSLLAEVEAEIRKSWRETCALNRNHPRASVLFNPDNLPAFHDPFAGGGAIPIEAQRIGLKSYASDLNPVSVLINKAMLDIPQRFRGQPAVASSDVRSGQLRLATQASGLSEDIRYFGGRVRDRAFAKLKPFYPKIQVTKEIAQDRDDLKGLVGQELTIMAWIWARTVRSPNPVVSGAMVPLFASSWLATKPGKEAWIEPVINEDGISYEFKVRKVGQPAIGETVNRRGGTCLLTKSPIDFKHIRAEGKAGRLGQRLMAIVAEGSRGRIYLSPTREMEETALLAAPEEVPETELPVKALGFRVQEYGMTKHRHLFTSRQLLALEVFSDAIREIWSEIFESAIKAGLPDDQTPLEGGGSGAAAYADAIAVYLAFALDRLMQQFSTLSVWSSNPAHELVVNMFSRQALAMTWDFGELNPFCNAASWDKCLDFLLKSVEQLLQMPRRDVGHCTQQDAQIQSISEDKLISTDPPYYDNIGYADLSDYFYVWLRRALRDRMPQLFSTVLVPKAQELVATPFRHGNRDLAEKFFMNGMTGAIHKLAEQSHPAFPVTIYYAFKQAESDEEGTASTGWETFLDAVIAAGFEITGTWPMRTERKGRMVAQKTNALASSIVLVCRKRPDDATTISRREFIRELNGELPLALDEMTRGGVNSPVEPVDLSQAIIGPGMAIFSKYAAVLEADGKPMSVRTALLLINRFLAEDDFDHDTQFCMHWFEQHRWSAGQYGEADVLARAKGTSVGGLQQSGVIESSKGELRLLRWTELSSEWSPESDQRLPIWEALHQLIRALSQVGESAAGALLARMPARAEPIRALAYRLYTLCERKGWTDDARAYNELVTAWSAIEQAAGEAGVIGTQSSLDI